ncbi:fibrous sheath CABYR-binding protein [Drosophila serrata]|uniref:fibrous sheath CABYR-binding protein n=1 Tax=Drosophila serrata TaxID=7274 RepID=UPI000A1D180F|nr:fibrous sheath CABYR-binding protein [Drosophila serrata]
MRVSSLFAVCVASLVASSLARPEPPSPYAYHGLPQQQSQRALPLNVHPQAPQIYQSLPQEQSFANFGAPQQSYLPPQMHLDAIEPVAPTGPASAEPLNPYDDSYNMAHRLSGVQHASGYNNGPQETKVHKHIYVHVPPKDFEEEDAIQTRVHHQQGPKQKHYKIVFIKAPSAPAIRPPVVPPPPQNEEKTLIYVLHKKPEQEQDIVIPTPPPTKPSKPEVYFIKYKTKKEEAPVYGPPPADMEPRQATAEDFAPLAEVADVLPPTTLAPEPEIEQPAAVPVPAAIYGPPTAAAYTGEEVQTTLPAAPANQYLPPATAPTALAIEEPSMAPIIVEEQQPEQRLAPAHVPATNYGPPNRFFLKKLK